MNQRVNILAALIVAIIITSTSCKDLETYSEIPEVEFLHVYLADNTDTLGNKVKQQDIVIKVIDGNGDLGLNRDEQYIQDEDNPEEKPDTCNLFLKTLKKNADGEYEPIAKMPEASYRIPYKQPIGQNKYLRAEITIYVSTPQVYIDFDTIRYEIYVRDRARNTSNIAISCDVPIKRNGTIYADGTTEYLDEKEDEEEKKK
ncbi:MAG: hypothetical protein K6F33_07135 [Bacteroidales bacterium]|nr:hypothetical protein [Bacteroidales bacterium]